MPTGYGQVLHAENKYGGEPKGTFGKVIDQETPTTSALLLLEKKSLIPLHLLQTNGKRLLG